MVSMVIMLSEWKSSNSFNVFCDADNRPCTIKLRCWRCLAVSYRWICGILEREWHHSKRPVELKSYLVIHRCGIFHNLWLVWFVSWCQCEVVTVWSSENKIFIWISSDNWSQNTFLVDGIVDMLYAFFF